MGCDIHIYAEVKRSGNWQKVDAVFENPYYKPEEPENDWNCKFNHEPFPYRNYNLFAILADVRNGSGFAGIKTGGGFNPIADPRGLPDDVSEEIKNKSDGWGCDGHSHSFFTVSELDEYDWNQLTTHQGWVTKNEYETFKKNGAPTYYCGDVSGSLVKHITNEEMESCKDREHSYTLVEWGSTYRSSVGDYFFEKTLPALKSLGNPDEVRIVFWFDN